MSKKNIHPTFLIIILGILAALGPFSIDMYLPAFGNIADEFRIQEQSVALTLTSYFFGIAFGQLIYGPIVDKYGRKRSLMAGLGIYIIASLGCALSSNLETLVLMRLLQALGGCAGMVASNAIITDVYEVDKRAAAFSSIMLVMGVAPLIAPSVGSMFIVHFHWNYIFYFLTVFASLVAFIILLFLPETASHLNTNPLRIKQIGRNYLEIASNKTFLLYTGAGSMVMAILFAYISSASFIFLNFYGLSKSQFSIIFAINASGIISGSYLNGWLTKKVNYKKIAQIATYLLLLFSAFTLSLAVFFPKLDYSILVTCIFSILFLIGFINPNVTAASFSVFKNNLGTASALGGSMRMAVAAVVAALVGIFQSNSLLTPLITTFILSVLVFISLKLTK